MNTFFKRRKPKDSLLLRQRHTNPGPSRQSFSYYASMRTAQSAAERNQPRGATDDKKGLSKESLSRLWQRFIKFAVALVLFACVISLVQVDNNPRISIVDGKNGFTLHGVAQYQAVAKASLHSSLANSNKITFNSGMVARAIKAAFPEVDDVSIVLPLIGHRPIVYLQLAKPVLILQSATQSVVVAGDGQALVTASQVNDLSQYNLPVITDKSHLKLKVGDPVLASTTVSFVATVLHQLSGQSLTYKTLVLPDNSEELDVHLQGQPYYIKFNLHQDNALQQVGTFLAVRQQLIKQGMTPSQYVDVRVPGRAYYK